MKYREFGRTGMKVSEIGFGAWAIGGNKYGNSYGSTDDKESIAAIRKALDMGCNFFDTADVYGWGHSEELLGRALRGQRSNAIIATKAGANFYRGIGRQNFTAKYIRFALEKSLQRLKTDYIDVYQLHNPPMKLIEEPKTYEVLQELKRDGKIRSWGISIFDPVEGLAAIQTGHPDCIQVVYNIFSHEPARKLMPAAQQVGCAIIAREPLSNGFLTGKFTHEPEFEKGDIRHDWPRSFVRARIQAAEKLRPLLGEKVNCLAHLALKYVLANPAVSVTIPGIKTGEQAEIDLSASDAPQLPDGLISEINDLHAISFGLN